MVLVIILLIIVAALAVVVFVLIQKQRGPQEGAGVELLFALLTQEIAHGDRDVAEVDIDRARLFTAVAHRAMIRDVVELVEMLERDAAPGLLFIKKGLDQQRSAEYLVARTVE